MAFVSRSRTLATGAAISVGGVMNTGEQVDMKALYGFTGHDYDHSGQVNRSIQDTYALYTKLISELDMGP